ncbi:tRNA wybutosine-synthesizing protein 3 homolog isoform X2 [Nannospalax galili]|uniref:tRNA wybutosine-synthesizing protein 3 homolog isoform X2 n=1 Tax=Nannospalax galili TaxID=1026970 RepID=UPI00111C3DEA|nr:tRNA wybutosine-synthesizing protein 3 homolog isoform X2 [Nannospalax galili]
MEDWESKPFSTFTGSSPDLRKPAEARSCAAEEIWSSPAAVANMAAPRVPTGESGRGARRARMDRSAEFSRWKAQRLSRADLSRKGSVDEDAVGVVQLLNARDEFFTTSSCAGRILLIDGSANGFEVQKQNCCWLLVVHKPCLKDDVHSVAVTSGFRNSGITVGKRGKMMLAVRSTHGLEVPLSHKGKLMVTEEYVEFLLNIANQKMEENKRRIGRFYDCLQHAMERDPTANPQHKTKEKKRPFCTHERRNQESPKENDKESDRDDDPGINVTFPPEDY